MSEIARVDAPRARALLEEGYVFLDVRSEQEFAAGHVPGAYNVPLLHSEVAGMTPNPDFGRVVAARFDATTKMIVGCKSGGRSTRAIEELQAAGYEALVELQHGFDGSRDAFGRLTPGWRRVGLPTETETQTGRSYADLRGD